MQIFVKPLALRLRGVFIKINDNSPPQPLSPHADLRQASCPSFSMVSLSRPTTTLHLDLRLRGGMQIFIETNGNSLSQPLSPRRHADLRQD
jgi:hypothetical protein